MSGAGSASGAAEDDPDHSPRALLAGLFGFYLAAMLRLTGSPWLGIGYHATIDWVQTQFISVLFHPLRRAETIYPKEILGQTVLFLLLLPILFLVPLFAFTWRANGGLAPAAAPSGSAGFMSR